MAARNNPKPTNDLVVNKEGRKPLFRSTTASSSENQRLQQGLAQPIDEKSGDRNASPGGSLQRARSNPVPQSAASASNSPYSSRLPRLGGGVGGFANVRRLNMEEAWKLAGEVDLGSRELRPIDGSPSPAPRPRRSMIGSGLEDAGVQRTLDDATRSPILPKLVPGIEDVPIHSTEQRRASPEKSYGWDLDEDFTAGDLQVSDSPRIRMQNRPSLLRNYGSAGGGDGSRDAGNLRRLTAPGSRNTRLEEIRAREISLAGSPSPESPPTRIPQMSKLDEIRAREQQAIRDIPIPDRRLTRSGQTKLDEIMRLESTGLSRRELAAAKLEEIKEFNSMSPRRSSSSSDNRRSYPGQVLAPPRRPLSAFESGAGIRVPDTPVTIFKSRRDVEAGANEQIAPKPTAAVTGYGVKRDQSRDLLRRLARAASASPNSKPDTDSTTQQRAVSPAQGKRPEPKMSALRRAAEHARNPSNSDSARSTSSTRRQTVGFVGVRRNSSEESAKSKRSSMNSEPDPTDRIAAEMNLFAPLDNHSERGSVRAPSPLVIDEDDEEDNKVNSAAATTPKASRPDPIMMPTPRVIGAYVDTPRSVRSRHWDDISRRTVVRTGSTSDDENVADSEPEPRERKSTTSDEKDAVERASSGEAPVQKARSRSRSTSRRRAPLRNSAKPPSVRDDLKELQLKHNIDDNTLSDLEEILSGRQTSDPEPQAQAESHPGTAPSDKPAIVAPKSSDSEEAPVEEDGVLTTYHRLSEALTSNLFGARDKKRVSEQEDKKAENKLSKVASSQKDGQKVHPTNNDRQGDKSSQQDSHGTVGAVSTDAQYQEHVRHHDKKNPKPTAECPFCTGTVASQGITYLHLPIPRLYHRTPHFRLTLLGLLATVLSLWYMAESAMCIKYCRPGICTPRAPCIWNFDDPHFGYAIPVKLDEWILAGWGRATLADTIEEAHDWVADLKDAALGRSILDIDVKTLSFENRRRHRRRLGKKGLLPPSWEPPPEQRAKWDAWHRERLAKERAKETGETWVTPVSESAGDDYLEQEELLLGRDEVVDDDEFWT